MTDTVNQMQFTAEVADANAIGKFRLVKVGANGLYEQSTDGDEVVGIALQEKKANDGNTIITCAHLFGICKAASDGNINVATVKDLASDANGRLKVAASGDMVVGQGLQTTTASKQLAKFHAGTGTGRLVA